MNSETCVGVLETTCIKQSTALRDHCSDTKPFLNSLPNNKLKKQNTQKLVASTWNRTSDLLLAGQMCVLFPFFFNDLHHSLHIVHTYICVFIGPFRPCKVA